MSPSALHQSPGRGRQRRLITLAFAALHVATAVGAWALPRPAPEQASRTGLAGRQGHFALGRPGPHQYSYSREGAAMSLDTDKIDDSTLANGRRLTNVGTFRAYIQAYLKNHPAIHQKDCD